MSYNSELQSNNADLQAILDAVNELPEAGSGGSGADGFSPIATVTQTDTGAVIEITDKYGKTEATITNGKDGKDGVDGADGKNPVKGTDYWTPGDKQEIAEYCRDEIASATVEVINIKEKYGLDNTGTTDCSALINQAIAEAKVGDTLYLPNGTYRINSTVTVDKCVNLDFAGTIRYYGTEFAFVFKGFNYSVAKFNVIRATSGSCIKLFSDWTSGKNFIQYSQFVFKQLHSRARTDSDSGGCCILAESVNSGWINENRFTGGQMNGGYGVYVDCQGRNAFNGNLFDSCGVESIGTGFYLANNCRNNMIFRCRHSESFEKFLHTVGECFSLKIISNSPFNLNENIISDETTGFVIASLIMSNTLYGNKGNFVRGTVVCDEQNLTKDLFDEPAGVFDMSNLLGYGYEYTQFVVDGPCTGVKLNKKYGYAGGINKFFVKFANANTKEFTISDHSGNQLGYTIPQTANSVVRFSWLAETGWQCCYEFSNADQIKTMIGLSDYVREAEAVKTVNNTSPDENGNIEIVVVQEDPIVVGSIEECVDTTKKYVLPDGYIYAYRKRFYPGGTYPNFTNQLPIALDFDLDGIYNDIGYKYDTKINNSGVAADSTVSGADFAIGLVPFKLGDTLRINQFSVHSGLRCIHFYDSTGKFLNGYQIGKLKTTIDSSGGKCTVGAENTNKIVLVTDLEVALDGSTDWWLTQDLAYVAFYFMELVKPQDIIITVNEDISYTVTEDRYEWSWENTGEPYTKPDYLAMIADLQRQIDELKNT